MNFKSILTNIINLFWVKPFKVLIREQDRKPGYLSGHTDGKIVIRIESDDLSLIGQIVEIKVTSAAKFSIEGELVEKTVSC